MIPYSYDNFHTLKDAFDFYLKEVKTKTEPSEVEGPKTALDVQVGGDHYKSFAIQPAEYCFANKLNNLQSEAISYISRYDRKWKNNKEKQIEDLLKAKHTIDMLMDFIKEND